MNEYICEVCQKVGRYPNIILTKGHCLHVGCMADQWHKLKDREHEVNLAIEGFIDGAPDASAASKLANRIHAILNL